MSGASYGWLHAAARLNSFLMKKGWKQIQCPVLLFQAENDQWVSCSEQNRFIDKMNRRCDAELICISGVKHELYNTPDSMLEDYLKKLFSFFENNKE